MVKTLIKRDGRTEEYNRDKMYKVIDWATNGDTQATEHILQSIEMKVYNNMKISDLYNEVIQTAANNISVIYQKYDDISRNLLLLKLYKENAHVKLVDSYPHLREFLKAGVEGNVYDPEVIKLFSEEELEAINNMIEYKRDYLFTYKGLYMFNKKYCKNLGKMKELPQIAYIVAAMYSFAYETGKDRLWHIKVTYDMLSNHVVTFATPRMLNSMKKRPQLASCVLNTPADDTWSLNQTDANAALYSKFAGGLAWYAGYIRSLGSKIFANEGYSDGMIPQVKRLEQTVSTFNQQSLRAGAAVVTFPWWHQDVMDAIMLKDAGGAEDNRARKLVYSMTFNEILFERAKNDEYITLFDPKETPDLNELHGEAFKERYLHYEKDGTLRKTKVKALDLFYRYLKVRKETGNLYAFFSDNVNGMDMTGKFVNASNLCMVGETRVLTKIGNVKIKKLDGKTVECWDGEKWSNTRFQLTGKKSQVMKVCLSNGVTLENTLYHKYPVIKDGKVVEMESKDLRIDDIIEDYELAAADIPERKKKHIIGIIKRRLKDSSRSRIVHKDGKYLYMELFVNFNIKDVINGLIEMGIRTFHFKPDDLKYKVLRIYSKDLKKLLDQYGDELGVEKKPVDTEYKRPDLKVAGVYISSKTVPVYCGNNPNNHRLVFDGVRLCQCAEITVPSSPSKLVEDKWYTEDGKQYIRTIKEAGEIGICNLASINVSKFMALSDHDKDMYVRVLLRGCDNILDYQFYPVKEGEISNKRNRPIGLGISNYAHYLASRGVKYTDKEAMIVTMELMHEIYYRIYNESVNLSIERGYFETYKKSNWAKHENNTPFHRFLKKCDYWLDNEEYPEVSKYIKTKLMPEWDKLAVRIRNFGVRFSLHAAQPPLASSGKAINVTEGIEPIFKTFYMEEGTQVLPTIVPDFKQLAEYYQICWDIPAKTILRLASLRQMFMDQSQSLNLYYDQDIDSAFILFDDIEYAKNLGIKTLYYHKTPKEKQSETCESCGV